MTLDELTEFVTENGFPKFRAKQIYDWLYKNVTDFDNIRACNSLQQTLHIRRH